MKQRNPVPEILTSPTRYFIIYFLFGSTLFGLVSSGLSTLFWDRFIPWLERKLTVDSTVMVPGVVISLSLFVLIIVYFIPFFRLLKRLQSLVFSSPETEVEANVKKLEEHLPGLITIMSPKEDSPAERAIRHHLNDDRLPHLKHCWLICTPKSQPVAEKLDQRFIGEGLGQRFQLHYGAGYRMKDPDSPDDPEAEMSLL
ncbi:MAG: hypothetical protein HC835_17175, partial [Oscillatoriales cyanobacterium RM2_1_1]|nr:hypothetical protein [Oscillatoriales cyanobacterium RM2_1_1]